MVLAPIGPIQQSKFRVARDQAMELASAGYAAPQCFERTIRYSEFEGGRRTPESYKWVGFHCCSTQAWARVGCRNGRRVR